MDKRYPRGHIHTKQWNGIGESIDIQPVGILYMLPGKTDTILLPWHTVERIEYETIPEELRDKADAK